MDPESSAFREAHFNIWTGNLPITHLSLVIFKLNDTEEKVRHECKISKSDVGRNTKSWEVTATDLPLAREGNIWYMYEFDIQANDGKVTHVSEYHYRSFTAQNRYICDILTAHPDHKLTSKEITDGLLHFLQFFVKMLSSGCAIETSIYDLEHMWQTQHGSQDFALDKLEIEKWVDRQFSAYMYLPARKDTIAVELVVFLATVRGSLYFHDVDGFKEHYVRISPMELEILRDKLSSLSTKDMPEWTIPFVRQTGLLVLWSLQQLHWLTVVAYLGKLYEDIDKLIEEKERLSRNKITMKTFHDVVIPKIIDNFGARDESKNKLLTEIPSVWGFEEDEKRQLAEIVQENFPSRMPSITQVPKLTGSGARPYSGNEKTKACQIRFCLWTGNLPFRKVTVSVHSETHLLGSKDCVPSTVGKDLKWTANMNNLQLEEYTNLYYNYEYDYEFEQGSVSVYTHKKEQRHRTIGLMNKVHLDPVDPSTLPAEYATMTRTVCNEGLMHYLHLLLEEFEVTTSLQTSLLDLEHLWKSSEGREEGSLTRPETAVMFAWAKQRLSKLATDSGNEILLAVTLYGLHLGRAGGVQHDIFLDESQLRQLRYTIGAVTKGQLTEWSMPHIRKAGLDFLLRLSQCHWPVVAAYLGNLFETADDILPGNDSIAKTPIPIDTVLNEVIPRILNNFSTNREVTTSLLLEIPSAWSFIKKEREQLLEVVHMNLPCEDPIAGMEVEHANIGQETKGKIDIFTFRDGNLFQTTDSSEENKRPTNFRLCIPVKNKVVRRRVVLELRSSQGKVTHRVKMKYSGRVAAANNWLIVAKDVYLPISQGICYRYIVTFQHWWGFKDKHEDEWRSTIPLVTTYDVFRQRSETSHTAHYCDHCTNGSFVHVTSILAAFTAHHTLKECLLDVEATGFPGKFGIDRKFEDYFKSWFEVQLAKVNSEHHNQPQQLRKKIMVLMMLLAKVRAVGSTPWFLDDIKMAQLQDVLRHISRDDVPSSMLEKEVENMCVWIVHCLKENWISLWEYFSNLLSVQRLRDLVCRVVSPPDLKDEAINRVLAIVSSLIETGKSDYSEGLVLCILERMKNVDELLNLIRKLSEGKFLQIMNNNTVLGSISARFTELIQDHAQNLDLLAKYWKSVTKIQNGPPEMIQVLRGHIHRLLIDTTWSPSDDNVQTLLLDSKIYEMKHNFIEVIDKLLSLQLSCDKLYCSHKLFLKVFQERSILQLLDYGEIKQLIEGGIQSVSSIRCQCGKPHDEEKIEIALQLQQAISGSEYLKGDEQAIPHANARIHQVLKRLSLETLLVFLCKASEKTSKASETKCSDGSRTFLTETIKNRLCRAGIDIKKYAEFLVGVLTENGKNERITIRSKGVASVLYKMLDLITDKVFPSEQLKHIVKERFPSIEQNILEVTHYKEFLLMVWQIPNAANYQLHTHKGLRNIAALLGRLLKHVSKGEVTVTFLDEIISRQSELNLLIGSVPGGDHSEGEWNRMCESAENLKKTYLRKLDFLENLIRYLQPICLVANVRNAKEVSAEVMQLIKETESVLLSVTSKPEYWGSLYRFTMLISELEPVVDSTTFLNVCRSFFERNIPNFEEHLPEPTTGGSIQPRPDCEAINYTEFIDLVHKRCLQIYMTYGLLVAECDLKVPVGVIFNLIEGIDDADELTRELALLEKTCGKSASKDKKDAIESLLKLPKLSQRAQQLKSVCRSFDVTEDDKTARALETLIILSHSREKSASSLAEIHGAVRKADDIEAKLTPINAWKVVTQLAKCKQLVHFVRKVIGEDLRYLVDAVEERSDENVNEETVSAFIDVKEFMTPLLKLKSANKTNELVEAIHRSVKLATQRRVSETAVIISLKINMCHEHVHSLEDLYKNVANRGEMTKEKILNATKHGVIHFKMTCDDQTCDAKLKYKRDRKHVIYGLEELNDLRSRALLLGNSLTHTLESDVSSLSHRVRPMLPEFVARVNAINDIVQLCENLIQSGHFEFREFQKVVRGSKDLESIRDQLREKFDEWQNDIVDARRQFFYLNFFQSKQLDLLDRFFNKVGEPSEDLSLLFRFVNPNVPFGLSLRGYYTAPTVKEPKHNLWQLGKALDSIFGEKTYTQRNIPYFQPTSPTHKDKKVTPGNVFVAELENESTKVINVLLHLYQSTTSNLPEPSQLVFCHSETSWEEVLLLLERCKAAFHKFPKKHLLYVLVNVEKLPTATQFKLVAEIKEMNKDNKHFLLALVCCAGHYHHIIDQFSPTYTHILHGWSDEELRKCFQAGWPSVEANMTSAGKIQSGQSVENMTFLTSCQPGLGKSEYVKTLALASRCGVSTLQVSGTFSKNDLVKMMQRLPRKRHYLLHIDATEMKDKQIFDCFIFEVVVIGMSVSGTLMCASPSPVVVLEVANTHRDVLQNSLPVCCAFPRKHLKWPGFDEYVVSEDINSSVQVVCHYLKALKAHKLDTMDIRLAGHSSLGPLKAVECRAILEHEFPREEELSFTIVETFLKLFAQELRRMSASMYFMTRSIAWMVGEKNRKDLRSKFVLKLKEMSKQFSSRSVKMSDIEESPMEESACADVDLLSRSIIPAASMVSRMEDMVMWHQSNHLFIVFHRQDSQTVTPIYRDTAKVPYEIQRLFLTQLPNKYSSMVEYCRISHDDLQQQLEKICRRTTQPFRRSKLGELEAGYALTPDNFLKMVLIYLRIESRIPVIIMGETGCGKTTLVMYLARVCEVPFDKMSLHAGVTEADIERKVMEWKQKATEDRAGEYWAFLDEINTCDHLGLLNEMVCHHRYNGEQLPSNLVFIAACNPYRIRDKINTAAGVKAKAHWHQDERSRLVYRVHPLPETMMDYVWDYGALNERDEREYIERMLGQNEKEFAALIVMSQIFMRKHEGNNHCVSLRDVYRCKHLKKYFMEKFFTTEKPIVRISSKTSKPCLVNEENVRSMILALCHCYHSRLIESETREAYRNDIAAIIKQKRRHESSFSITGNHIKQAIESEQMELLRRMKLPNGIAKNEALRENVFVVLVSVLNQIPVFVVGKPGCSKSLSMQLIRNTLKGPGSHNEYFASLDSVYVISYQGSESSTSEGIIKIFDKAKKYKDHNPGVIPVVLLDEIGLAQNSPYNPLRVLHSQLEPKLGGLPSMAVVGISNYELDPAKMNRAIYLSRPDPTEDDLKETALSIRDDMNTNEGPSVQTAVSDDTIQDMAKSYYDYQSKQREENFHGLRDYYSLIKYVTKEAMKHQTKAPRKIVEKGLFRNFGGSQSNMGAICTTFGKNVAGIDLTSKQFDVLNLITENVDDRNARHLMLITRGDSALNILEQRLQELRPKRQYMIMYGSKFSNDKSEHYNYQTLNDIILRMEDGFILVLKDLECIYGSLYDMLNQNYTIVGSTEEEHKRNCRVALGPYSNPMCQVHDNFRCIVMIDEKKVDTSDSPFLNRFEKQFITIPAILSDLQRKALESVQNWCERWTEVDVQEVRPEEDDDGGLTKHQRELKKLQEMFLGFHEDTLPSLIYEFSSNRFSTEKDPQRLAEICQNELLKLACPDAVLKLIKSKMYEDNPSQVINLQSTYFNLPVHGGFRHFYETHINTISNAQVVVYTHSSIHFDLQECVADSSSFQVDKLSYFKSQQDLSSRIQRFWKNDAKLLVLQCMPTLEVDAANMALAKCLLDQYRKDYLDDHKNSQKHVCMVIHIDRSQMEITTHTWHFSFLCGWDQFTIDSLESKGPVLADFLQKGLAEIFSSKSMQWDAVIDTSMLVWCFNCIRYLEHPRSVDSSLQLAHSIFQSKKLLEGFQAQIKKYLEKERKSGIGITLDWQLEVACDTERLRTCSTLVGAMLDYIKHEVRIPLAKIIVFLEKFNSWNGACHHILTDDIEARRVSIETEDYWQACFQERGIFDIAGDDIVEPRGSETCPIDRSLINLRYPFFVRFHHMIEGNRRWLLEGTSTVHDRLRLQLHDLIRNVSKLNHNTYLQQHQDDFVHDLLNVFSEKFAPNMNADMRVEAMQLLVVLPEASSHNASDCFQRIADFYTTMWLNQKIVSAEIQLISTYEKTTNDARTLLKILRELPSIDGIPTKDVPDIPLTAGAEAQHSPSEEHFQQDEVSPSDIHIEMKDANDMPRDEMLHASLVTEICRAVLPVRKVLDSCKGLEQWQQQSNFVLLLAEQVSRETSILSGQMCSHTTILHFLRLCRDFVTLVISLDLPNKTDLVSSLAEIAVTTDFVDVLDNEIVFRYISKHLDSSTIPQDKKERFLCMAFNICLDANLDTPVFHFILDSLVTPSRKLPVGSQAVLRNILHSDIKQDTKQDFLPLCEDVIFTGTINEEQFPNVYAIDQALHKLDKESHLTIVCCDIIEDIAFSNISWAQIRDIHSRDCQLIKTAIKAAEVVYSKSTDEGNEDDSKEQNSMQYVCAGSFLRSFVRAASEFFTFTKDPRLFMADAKHHVLANALNNILHNTDREVSGLLLYLLKCMRAHTSLFEFVEWRDAMAKEMEVLSLLKIQDRLLTSRIGHNPISYLRCYEETMAAVTTSLKNNDQQAKQAIDDLIKKAESNCDNRLGLVAAFSEAIYWGQSCGGTIDSDKSEATKLCDKIKERLPDSISFFLQRLLSTNVSHDFYDISVGNDRPISSLYQVSVALHATCLDITAGGKIDLSLQRDKPVIHNEQPQDTPGALQRRDCDCGFSLFTTFQGKLDNCPICSRECKDDPHDDQVQSQFQHQDEIQDVTRIILRILHNSIGLSRLLQPKTSQGPQDKVKYDDWGESDVSGGKKDRSSSSEREAEHIPLTDIYSVESESETLQNQLEDSWRNLAEILSQDDEDIALLLHSVLHSVVTSRIQHTVDTLQAKIHEVLVDAFKVKKRYLEVRLKAQHVHEKDTEFQVNELPCLPDQKYTGYTKPRLFRKRNHPNYADFKMQFLLHEDINQSEFPFLRLYMQYKEPLRYVRNLLILLKWTALITKRLGQSIERGKAVNLKLSTLLDSDGATGGHSHGENLKDVFEDFSKAWNDICDGWDSLTGSSSPFQIMSDDKLIIDCVMDTSNKDCPLFRMIKVLQKTQNDFLKMALTIASTHYSPSLNFLVRADGVSGIQRVSLDDAQQEIIDFEWSDKLLHHCDVGTEYGEGCLVTYNFMVIERKLAQSLVLNKAILTDGAVFSQFAFSDELIHASSAIVDDVCQIIQQEDLDERVKSTVVSRIESQRDYAHDLLENLEIMLVLLKKTGGNRDKALEEYIDQWSNQLPGSFSRDLLPEPTDAIKLSHVIAFHNIPENHLADNYIGTLELRFRRDLKDLPSKTQDNVRLRMEGFGIKQLEDSRRLIRLFAFRYLRPGYKVQCSTVESRLLEIMERSAGNTMDLATVSTFLEGVKVRHIFKIHELIGTVIKDKRQCEQQQPDRSIMDGANAENARLQASMKQEQSPRGRRQRRTGNDFSG